MSTLNSTLISGFTPPPGVTPNFIDPPSIAPISKVMIAVTLGVMYCFLLLRIYTRLWVTRSFGVDDFLCLLSAATITSYCVVVLIALDGVLGPHQWNVPISELSLPLVLKDSILTIILYGVSAIFLKSSLLTFYLRLFGPLKIARILLWTSLVVITLFYTICFVIDAIICGQFLSHPNLLAMDSAHSDPDESCSARQRPIWIIMGVFSVISDFYILTIPVCLTLRLRLPLRRKIGVCCIFLTGLLACAFSILATVYRSQLFRTYDFTWLASLTYAFIAAEINVGIACSCMPVTSVVIHSLAKTTTWYSVIRVITRRTSKDGDFISNSGDPTIDFSEERSPNIPQAPRIEPSSFMRKAYLPRSRRMSRSNELSIIDEDYHTQLRREASFARVSQRSQINVLQS
ncbi:uncharacterized protein F4807DRAFT_396986 [Annulohypoxylon truncatum]|uniref:uncharacterized protein n=1 Tax=Annulohypoxylon truncatum TaxID=327061 RepID=UPI002007A6FB|nr:uncharacterized protein F4807DRAFT_396986 [Annulohypoxylon truncatum]KAI1211647.1 hypothetical protein F4807DRAFT_396986 [Annulohypoxylon truncatum]